MKVFVTGYRGYIGSHLVDVLREEGFHVVGCDLNLFEDCEWYAPTPPNEELVKDVRDVTPRDLDGIDAVMHLAAISNDPMGDLDEQLTRDVNFHGSVHMAETAKSPAEGWSALQHVGSTGQQWAVPRLLRIAKTSTNSSVIHNAISEIGELGGDEAVKGLVELFDHDFSHVPRSEMESKGRLQTNFNPIVCSALTIATGENSGRNPDAWRRYLTEASR